MDRMEVDNETTNVSECFHWELIMEGKPEIVGEFVMHKMVVSILEYRYNLVVFSITEKMANTCCLPMKSKSF